MSRFRKLSQTIWRCQYHIKGRVAIRVLNKFKELRQKQYWGNHFWAKEYCVDTVGLDSEKIRKYVKYQEKQEKIVEQQQRLF